MGVGRALHEQVVFDQERITSIDRSTYPLLRFNDRPNVTTVIIPSQKPSTGSGEPPQVSVTAASAMPSTTRPACACRSACACTRRR